MNALKHGLSAKAIVLEGEDPRQFEALRSGLEEDFEPKTVVERELVEHLSGSFWRLRRVPRAEAQILERHVKDALYISSFGERPLVAAFMSPGDDSLGKLSRHQAGLLNAITAQPAPCHSGIARNIARKCERRPRPHRISSAEKGK
jgi:hypothetical protein